VGSGRWAGGSGRWAAGRGRWAAGSRRWAAGGGLQVGAGGLQAAGGGLRAAGGGLEAAGGGLQVGAGGLEAGGGGLQVGAGGLRAAGGGLEVGAGGLRAAGGGLQVGAGGLQAAGGGLEAAEEAEPFRAARPRGAGCCEGAARAGAAVSSPGVCAERLCFGCGSSSAGGRSSPRPWHAAGMVGCSAEGWGARRCRASWKRLRHGHGCCWQAARSWLALTTDLQTWSVYRLLSGNNASSEAPK